MVNYLPPPLDRVFAALGDETRMALLERLAVGEAAMSELARPFALSLPAIAKHLRVLESAGLVVGEKRGRVHHYRLNTPPLREAAAWINHYQHFWNDQIDALNSYLQETNHDDPPR